MTQDTTNNQKQNGGSVSIKDDVSFGIMVVDDEQDILGIVRKYLQKWNFEVDTFSDPFVALEQFKSRPDYYRLLITDIRMPGMTGTELASKVINLKPEINVVLMTAFETDNVALPVNAQGSTNVVKRQDILRKPFRLEQICQAVKKQLVKE
jgi:two-component system response regulator HydG